LLTVKACVIGQSGTPVNSSNSKMGIAVLVISNSFKTVVMEAGGLRLTTVVGPQTISRDNY
jgi:hypothetical protein